MALDSMVKDLVDETAKAINAAQGQFQNPVRISPRRMRALHLMQQQQIRWQRPDGQIVLLVEDDMAPELAEAIAAGIEAPVPEELSPTEDELAMLRQLRAQRKAAPADAYRQVKNGEPNDAA